MLDEQTLRRASFVEGQWTELADGQKWCFPRPRIKFKPVFVDGKVDVGGGPSFGPEFDPSMDILFGIVDVDPLEKIRVKFEMAVRLLRVNYDLTDEHLSGLLELDPSDPASMERFAQLGQIFLGQAPKQLADTSVAPL